VKGSCLGLSLGSWFAVLFIDGLLPISRLLGQSSWETEHYIIKFPIAIGPLRCLRTRSASKSFIDKSRLVVKPGLHSKRIVSLGKAKHLGCFSSASRGAGGPERSLHCAFPLGIAVIGEANHSLYCYDLSNPGLLHCLSREIGSQRRLAA